MSSLRLLVLLACLLVGVVHAEVLVQEDFEDVNLRDRGFYDTHGLGSEPTSPLSIAGPDEVKAKTGQRCLKIYYPKWSHGGWMHVDFEGVPEFYCRYYRLFPEGWEWPRGYGPHDTIVFAGSYGAPTDTDLSVYLDFWKTADTFVRVATARQQWGYGGYSEVLRKYGGVANRVAFDVAQPDKVELGRWHCVEYAATLSALRQAQSGVSVSNPDPGRENGRLRLWVNGKLCCDLDGLPLVDEQHAGILFHHWMLGPYFHSGSHKEQWNYLDSLVIATEYVGTIEQAGNQPPRARFTYERDWGSMTARFDAGRSEDPDGAIVENSWGFGDGQSGSGKTTSHTYSEPGDYTVTLTVKDEGGETHSATARISVGPTVGSGNGLKAEYYDGQELKGRPRIRVAREIAFERRGWDGRFLWGGVGDNQGDNYSCRWTGYLQPVTSEEYTLTYEVNDGGRVWLDGTLVIDAWDEAQTASASLGELEAGRKYPIRIEHHKGTFEATRDWKAKLYWQTPTIEKTLVPPTAFYLPPSGDEVRTGQRERSRRREE